MESYPTPNVMLVNLLCIYCSIQYYNTDGKEDKFYPVLKGVTEGELVVSKANFLIDSQSQISGVVASAYGGTLGSQEKKAPPIHQH